MDDQMKPAEVRGMFDGPLRPLFWRLAMPILMGMLFNLLYTTVDTFFISLIDKSDPSIIGGTGLIFPLIFIVIAISNGIMTGVSSLVARAVGEQNRKVLSRVADSGVALGTVLGVLFVITGYVFARPMIRALGAEGDYAVHALLYFRWILPGLGLMMGFQVLVGVVQGEGQMKYLMITMSAGNILNMIFDPFFILERVGPFPGLGMGVAGAALATVIGQSLAGCYLIWVFAAGKTLVPVAWKIRNIRLSVVRQITSVGFPNALSQIILAVSFLVINRILVDIDPKSITAASLCGRLDQLVMMPIFALSAALMTIVGQNMGRGLKERARQAWITGLLMAIAVTLLTATAMVLAAPYVYKIFTDDPAVLDYTVRQTRVVEYSFLLAAVAVMARSVFPAMGRPWPGLIITALRMILFMVPFVVLFVYVFDWGIYGVWGGLVAGNILGAAVSLVWVRTYWQRIISGRAEYVHT